MTAPACTAYEAQKIDVVTTSDSRAQDGTPIEKPHFVRGGVTITRHEFASLYAAETGSNDVARYEVAEGYPFTVLGLTFLGVGLVASVTGGAIMLATSSSTGAHTAGEVTLVADAYDHALERRLSAECAASQKPARLTPIVGPTFTGVVVRF